jgi:uncharacterized protein YjiS (DUF1127 family)
MTLNGQICGSAVEKFAPFTVCKLLISFLYYELCKICTSLFAALHLISVRKRRVVDSKERNYKMFEVLKTRIATWKRYSRTVSELQSLSNRELADLGIMRTDIQRVAKDAVRS